MAGLVLCTAGTLLVGLVLVPCLIGLAIYRARELYYVDTGTAKATMAITSRRRRQRDGDRLGHSFGSWPKGQGAGYLLGTWVRDRVHAQRGRLTGTAFPWTAKRYLRRGMHDDGKTAFVMVRVASEPARTEDS